MVVRVGRRGGRLVVRGAVQRPGDAVRSAALRVQRRRCAAGSTASASFQAGTKACAGDANVGVATGSPATRIAASGNGCAGEAVDDRERRAGGVGGMRDVEIEAVPGRDLEAARVERAGGVHAVDRDHLRVQRREVGREDAAVGGVHEAEANALARPHLERLAHVAVHGDDVAPAAVVHEVVRRVEVRVDRAVGAEPPVVEHPDDVARVGRRLAILDDQDAEEPALDLLARAQVGMEPERPGVLRHELVDEASRPDAPAAGSRPATPSIAFGTRTPCQWTVVSTGSRLVKRTRRRSPTAACRIGPGTWPL